MKRVLWILLPLSLTTISVAQDGGQTGYTVASRSAHETVWQRVVWQTNQAGRVLARTNEFVETATGLNHFDQTTQQWQPSREEWEVYRDGIVARAGQHKVILAHNLNLAGAVDVLLADGVTRLVSSPVSLGFYDPVDGKQQVIAEVKPDCVAARGAAANEIVFRNCFDRIRGSIRYFYTKAGLLQEIVLEQKLELPEGFSDRSRLECYTVFASQTTWPRITTRVLRGEKDPLLRALMVEPDFTDAELDFGSMAMRAGTAFCLGDEETTRSIRVGKQFQMIGGQPVLIEGVEFKSLEPLLAGLANVERSGTGGLAINSSRQIKRAREQARLPREHFRTWDKAKQIQLASSPLIEPAVVLDYELLSSATNQALASDKTWFVSGLVNLSGTTRLEGCVIKFTNSTSAKINLNGPIDCRTGPYRPAIFTSQYDNTVGDAIGTGTPTNYPAALVINTTDSALHDLRFSYATNAVSLGFSAGQINLTNVQFVNCQYPIDSTGNDENIILADNCLFDLAKYGITGGRDLIVRGQHLTAHRCEKFAYSPSGGDSYAYLTNCLLVGVTNWGSDFTFTTNSTAYYATDVSGIFQTVGAGSHYLMAGSTNRDLGTTNISANLLGALKTKTTWPPVVLSNVSITASTNLLPQAPRDTNSLPDLGFHYDPIDWLTHWYTVSNATLTVSNGVVLACYNDTGVWMADGSSIVSTGTPLAPNWFTRYSLVQEQALALGSDVGLAVNSYHYGTNAPTGNFRFTKFSCPAGDGYHLYHSDDFAFTNLTVRDCEFWNGFSYFSGSSSLGGAAKLNNNLFYRSRPWAQNTTSQQSLAVSNNLIVGASAAFYGPTSDLWKVYDNAFEACTFFSSSRPITNGYNAYINCPSWLNPTNDHVLFLTNLAWQTGFPGDFYQPTNSALINAGSLTNAGLAGLYHYATTTNQVKESNSPLDIGYHYVALSNGLPVDTDGDSQADYFEDTNGNGVFETTTDFGDVTNSLYVPNTATNFQSITEDEAEKVDRPDAMGAGGPNHYMAVLNFVVKIYNKSTGQAIVTNSLNSFLGLTITNGPYAGTYPNPQYPDPGYRIAGDPRVVYDHLSQRWFACALDGTSGHVLLAVSTNSDPVGNGGSTWMSDRWRHYLVPIGSGTSLNTDYDRLGVDGNGVYIVVNRFDTIPPSSRIAALPKEQFLNPPPTNIPNYFVIDYASNHWAQPAVNFEPIATNDPAWFVAVAGTNIYYNQLKWVNGFGSAPAFQLSPWGELPFSQSYLDASAGSAPQSNTQLRVYLLDSRLMMATLRSFSGTQYLWTCHHVLVNQYGTNGTPNADRSAVAWYKIQIAPSVSITDSNRVFDSSASNPKYYYYPSLAVNRNGDMVIGFSGSSVNDYMGAYYWGQLHNGSSLTAPTRYFAGKDWLDRTGVGATVSGADYSYTTLDPVDGLTFWTIQEYAETRTSGAATYTWGTRITAVRPY